MPAQVVSLAGRDGFGGNANVYGFDFSGGTTSSTCRPRNHNLISLAGRQGFGRDANVYGFDFSDGSTSTCSRRNSNLISLAGREGFGRDANVYSFDFSGGNTSTCSPRNHTLVSLAGRQGFGRDANVYGFDFSGGTTSTYVPANHVYRRPIATPEAHVQSPASKPKREKWTTRLKNFHRRLWTERHQQSESQKRRAAKLERHFGDHMLEYLIGCGAG